MSFFPPKRLFHIPSMSTVVYEDAASNIEKKGYVAISHVWGNQQLYSADKLGINSGVEWKVPLSNPNKIRRLVEAMNYYEKEYCWFDILCMPQDRQNEINLEIPFMGDYYNGAEMTLVLSDVEYVITREFVEWYGVVYDCMKTGRNFTEDEVDWMMHQKNLLDVTGDRWFMRVWTLQEVVLSNVVIIQTGKSYLDLTDFLLKLGYLSEKNVNFCIIFGKSEGPLFRIYSVKKAYDMKHEELLGYVLDAINVRECYRKQDKFYGILGILGYKDFPVNYEIDEKLFNVKIAQYMHSKGNATWASFNGSIGPGFIQPMYEQVSFIGSGWKEDKPGICDIVFEGDALRINLFAFATVTNVKKFAEAKKEAYECMKWCVDSFRKWDFNMDDIADVLMQHIPLNDEFFGLVKELITQEIANKTISEKPSSIFRNNHDKHSQAIINAFRCIALKYDTTVIVKAKTVNGCYIPMLIHGSVDIGDEIKLTKLHDIYNRSLAIISSEFGRKNVCMYSILDIPEHLFTPCKFPL